MTKLTSFFYAFLGVILFVACDAKDNANALINTQFGTEICDSSHLLAPKTYSYLKNLTPPLGIKPVIVVVDKIEKSEMGTIAENIFDKYCEKTYSGNTFRNRGVLILASKNPELIQVRVGSTYDVYCRMKGSAAGSDYLEMQLETAKRGIDELCPVALQNVFKDIEAARDQPWHKRLALRFSHFNLQYFLGDIASPSQGFFNQFYFRPFVYLIGLVKSILGNWILSFLFIVVVYYLTKRYVLKLLSQKLESPIPELIMFVVGLVITIPSLAAIAVLSSSRTEDIIALQEAHIPSAEIVETVTHWSTQIPPLWLLMVMLMVYYLKYLLSISFVFADSHLPDDLQQWVFQNNKQYHDKIILLAKYGVQRGLISRLSQQMASGAIDSFGEHNFHEMDNTHINHGQDEYDENGEVKKRPIDLMFYNEDSPQFKQAPSLAVMLNTAKEALIMTLFLGIISISLLSYTYVVYFIILWGVQLIYRLYIEYRYALREFEKVRNRLIPFRIGKIIWFFTLGFFLFMAVVLFILRPSYEEKDTVAIAAVEKSIPEDLTGLYFVKTMDGENVSGATARIAEDGNGNYLMKVYSDLPTRNFPLQLDKEKALFHSDILGEGYIIYDKQTKSININFSDLWVITN